MTLGDEIAAIRRALLPKPPATTVAIRDLSPFWTREFVEKLIDELELRVIVSYWMGDRLSFAEKFALATLRGAAGLDPE